MSIKNQARVARKKAAFDQRLKDYNARAKWGHTIGFEEGRLYERHLPNTEKCVDLHNWFCDINGYAYCLNCDMPREDYQA